MRTHKGDEEEPKGKGRNQDRKNETRRDQARRDIRAREEIPGREKPLTKGNHKAPHGGNGIMGKDRRQKGNEQVRKAELKEKRRKYEGNDTHQ